MKSQHFLVMKSRLFFTMKSTAGCLRCLWMSLCPDLQLGPVTAPSLKPHVNGTCCDCCWYQSWQGPVQSAGLQGLAPLHSGISQVCSRAGGCCDGGGVVRMWAAESICGWQEASAHIWWPCSHPPIPERSLTMSWAFLFLVVWGTSGSWQTSVVSPVLGSGSQYVPHSTSSGWSWHQVGFGAWPRQHSETMSGTGQPGKPHSYSTFLLW